MNKRFSFFFVAVALVISLQNCQKGEPVAYQSYMRFRMEAFYPDSALYYQVKLNDSVLSEFSGHSGNTMLNFVAGQKGQLPLLDSARLKITLIKKNGRNYILDSVVYLTNDNHFLLLQFNENNRPVLINKKLAAVTERKPGKDSVYVRFYYNDFDEIRRGNNILKNLDLQIYSYRRDSLGGADEPPLKLEGKFKPFLSGQISPYIALRYNSETGLRNFVFDIYPPNSGPTTAPQYRHAYDEVDGFIGGNLPVNADNGPFQSFRITKGDLMPSGRNGLFLFGFK